METLNLSTIYIMHVGVSDVKFLFSNWYFSYKPKDCQTFTSPFCHFFIVLFTMKLLLGPDKTERCPVFRISMVSKSYWLKGIIIWWISSLILIWTLLTTTSNDFFQALAIWKLYADQHFELFWIHEVYFFFKRACFEQLNEEIYIIC